MIRDYLAPGMTTPNVGRKPECALCRQEIENPDQLVVRNQLTCHEICADRFFGPGSLEAQTDRDSAVGWRPPRQPEPRVLTEYKGEWE